MYPIHPVDRRFAEAVETLGSKSKFWFSRENRRTLFKAEERGTGEDWAEKVACHLCELLGLPHVHYELAAEYDGSNYVWPGVICETCSPAPVSLVLGNQLLLEREPAYPAHEGRKYKVREHTVQAVAEVVQALALPGTEWTAGMSPSIGTALDVFVGYVMLDAWIANQDRHHENWGALKGDALSLAPTFDHGASMARNISDEERKERLTTKDAGRAVASFAERARSAFYSAIADARPLSTLDAFVEFARLVPEAAQCWLDQLAAVTPEAVQQILDEVTSERMSKITKEFTIALMSINQERLLQKRTG